MDLEQYLLDRLQKPLPGVDAHRELIPDMPGAEARLKGAPATARRSAVIVPLLTRTHALPSVLFTLRSEELSNHRGQISFPGGRLDEGETAEEAAVRELHEETGVEPHDVVVLGQLSQIYIPPSNSVVTPFIGMLRPPEHYEISEREVTEIFDVPLMNFTDNASLRSGPRTISGQNVDVPQWHVHPKVPLWGATAMILNELVWLTREYLEHS